MDEAESASKFEQHHDEEGVNADYDQIDEVIFPHSEFTEEEDLAYYYNN